MYKIISEIGDCRSGDRIDFNVNIMPFHIHKRPDGSWNIYSECEKDPIGTAAKINMARDFIIKYCAEKLREGNNGD